jgi:hypothetical protein
MLDDEFVNNPQNPSLTHCILLAVANLGDFDRLLKIIENFQNLRKLHVLTATYHDLFAICVAEGQFNVAESIFQMYIGAFDVATLFTSEGVDLLRQRTKWLAKGRQVVMLQQHVEWVALYMPDLLEEVLNLAAEKILKTVSVY